MQSGVNQGKHESVTRRWSLHKSRIHRNDALLLALFCQPCCAFAHADGKGFRLSPVNLLEHALQYAARLVAIEQQTFA